MFELAEVAGREAWNNEARPKFPDLSLVAMFSDQATHPHKTISYSLNGDRGLPDGDRKIVAAGEKSRWELYDIAKVRSVTTNDAERHPDVVKELADIWPADDAEYTKQGLKGAAICS